VSKNYLTQRELDQLNRLVTMFLDFAEDRAERRIETRMDDWITQTDRFLDFNERAVLNGPGRISNQQMELIIAERYAAFDAERRVADRITSEREAEVDMRQLQTEAKRLASAVKQD